MSKKCFRPPPKRFKTPDIREKKNAAQSIKHCPFPPPSRNVWTLPAIKRGKKERGARFGRMTKELGETHRGLRFLGATPADA